MGLFRRRARPGEGGPGTSQARRDTLAHLEEFVRTRVGIEAYVEPETRSMPTTVLLIATTGEWTRRRVPDPASARRIARTLGIPVYDVHLTGYPQRMRDWNSRQRALRRRAVRETGG